LILALANFPAHMGRAID